MRLGPRGPFSWTFGIEEGGATIAEVDVKRALRSGRLVVAGEVYVLGRDRSTYVLSDAVSGQEVASAQREGHLRESFRVRVGEDSYELRRAGLGRKFVLRQDGAELGAVEPDHPFTRNASVILPERLRLAARVFLTVLVLLCWKEDWGDVMPIAPAL